MTGLVRSGTVLERRYRLGPVIARGGMSTVYRALDLRLDRPVAVKVMDARFADDPGFLTRFELEARSVARLRHPGVVAVFDQGTDLGHPFMVMELVDGGTLRELLLERGPMPPHAAVAVMTPLLEALGAAHDAGLVHRDVKPENVLIADDGHVKIADFGLVRALAGAGTTSTSVILGTAAYLSPEQVTTGDTDPRSDVYSAGILLYEVLTGVTPFSADTPLSLAYQRVHADVPAPGDAIEGVPALFDDIVAVATSRDPDERYADCLEMADALRAAAHELDLPPFRVPAPEDSATHRSAAAAAEAAARGELPPEPPDPDARTEIIDDSVDAPTRVVAVGPPGRTRVDERREHRPGPSRTRDLEDEDEDEGRDLDDGFSDDLDDDAGDRTRGVSPGHLHDARSGRRKALVWLAVILLLASCLAVGAWYLGSGRWTAVPSIQGRDHDAAVAALEAADLTVTTADVYSDDVPRARPIDTDPPAGSRIVRGDEVVLRISAGRPRVPAIDAARDADEYTRALEERTLSVADRRGRHDDEIRRGRVIEVIPPAGTELRVGAAVTLVVSDGSRPIPVPDVRGLSVDEARELLKSVGFPVANGTTKRFDEIPGGRVVGTEPAAGRELSTESPVTLVVSTAVEVPDVRGESPERASERLTEAGLVPVRGDDVDDPSVELGRVARTEPSSGSLVDPDDPKVRIRVTDTFEMPSVRLLSSSAAKERLTERGLRVEVRSRLGRTSGFVVGQSPSAGTSVRRGDTVTITLP